MAIESNGVEWGEVGLTRLVASVVLTDNGLYGLFRRVVFLVGVIVVLQKAHII